MLVGLTQFKVLLSIGQPIIHRCVLEPLKYHFHNLSQENSDLASPCIVKLSTCRDGYIELEQIVIGFDNRIYSFELLNDECCLNSNESVKGTKLSRPLPSSEGLGM